MEWTNLIMALNYCLDQVDTSAGEINVLRLPDKDMELTSAAQLYQTMELTKLLHTAENNLSAVDFVKALEVRLGKMLDTPDDEENAEMYDHSFSIVYDGMHTLIPFDAETYYHITECIARCEQHAAEDAGIESTMITFPVQDDMPTSEDVREFIGIQSEDDELLGTSHEDKFDLVDFMLKGLKVPSIRTTGMPVPTKEELKEELKALIEKAEECYSGEELHEIICDALGWDTPYVG